MLQNFARLDLNRNVVPKDNSDSDFETYAYNEPGSPPGTLIIDANSQVPNLFLIDYNSTDVVRIKLITPEDCQPYLDTESVSWVDVQGLGSEDVLQRLGKIFNLHPLLLEDAVNIPQRPKVDEYEGHLMFVAHMVTKQPEGKAFLLEQVSLIVGRNYLLTIQEEPELDAFEPVRRRIDQNKGIIRHQGTDYLAYALIDAIIDGFFPVLEDYGERLEDLQDEVVSQPTKRTLDKIHRVKRELLLLRRAIWPQRDAINSLIREDSQLISQPVRIYLRDCYDHTVQVIDMVETYRELASNLMDIYLSSISNRMNEVMQTLTVISTIFIPLTFLAGIYGMNFDRNASPFNMPELGWYYGYPLLWGIMLMIAIALLIYFWRKGWLSELT